jgi:hypothetical protein
VSGGLKSGQGAQNLLTNFKNSWNSAGQSNQTLDQSIEFGLANQDKIIVSTGYYSFDRPGSLRYTNVPLHVNWATTINSLKIVPGFGLDFVSISAPLPSFDLKLEYPINSGLTIAGFVESGIDTSNANTIGNQVSKWQFGPSLSWKLDPETNFSTALTLGNYDDGNSSQQWVSKIERQMGQFHIGANLSMLGFAQESDRGYFTPPDFIVYGGEIGWKGDVFDFLKCGAAISIGRQRVNDVGTDAASYEAKCNAKISDFAAVGIGYSYSNLRNQINRANSSTSEALTTQLSIKF